MNTILVSDTTHDGDKLVGCDNFFGGRYTPLYPTAVLSLVVIPLSEEGTSKLMVSGTTLMISLEVIPLSDGGTPPLDPTAVLSSLVVIPLP